AGLLVVGAPRLDAERFGDRDLDLGDVVAVPEGLEDPVGEPQDEDVLHRLFAEVVIDPVDLVLVEHPGEQAVERLRALVVVPERLRQRATGVEAPERGHELAAGQVARRAEDDEGERLVVGRHQAPRASRSRTFASRRTWRSAREKLAPANSRASAMARSTPTT